MDEKHTIYENIHWWTAITENQKDTLRQRYLKYTNLYVCVPIPDMEMNHKCGIFCSLIVFSFFILFSVNLFEKYFHLQICTITN